MQDVPRPRRFRRAFPVIAVSILIAGLTGWHFFYRYSRIDGVRNVVLISIDTCRADHLSGYGYKRKTTPHIDAVAEDGVLFEQASTPIPLTTPAHGSMLTGTYPPTHGARLNNGIGLADSSVTLAEILRDAGYQTAAFVGAFPLDTVFGLNQGFETYDCQFTRRAVIASSHAERTAEEVSRPALAWLEQHAGKPFFLFLHYYDPHLPYLPPEPFASAYADDPYAGEIAYVDDWIGQVLSRLRALGAYDNTLLVITADHGESVGEHGEKSHGFFIYQVAQHVPLVIRAPRGRSGSRFEGRVSLVDLVPTVLDLVGLEPKAVMHGVSLRRPLEGRPVPGGPRALYCESLVAAQFQCSPLYGVLEGPWKYIRAPRQELYDLTKDAGEKTNVFDSEPLVAERLRERLEGMLQEFESESKADAHATVDPDTVVRLQSLGYVGGGAAPSTSAFDPGLEDPKDFIPTFERLERANALFHSDVVAEAEKELLDVVRSRPGLIAAHEQLALIASHEHRPADAVERYATIVDILTEAQKSGKPVPVASGDLASAQLKLAFALGRIGKEAEAVPHLEEALRIKPDLVEAHSALGLVLLRAGKSKKAMAHFEQVLKIQPNSTTALNTLAWIHATDDDPRLRNGAKAVRLAEQACALTDRKVVGYLGTLAAAYAESRRFDEAVATAQEALALARAADQTTIVDEIQSRVALYRDHRPYRAVN